MSTKISSLRSQEVIVRKNNFIYEWRIDGFDQIPFISNHAMCSSPFCFSAPTDSVWQVCLMKEFRNIQKVYEKQEEFSKESVADEKLVTNGKDSVLDDKNVVTNGKDSALDDKNVITTGKDSVADDKLATNGNESAVDEKLVTNGKESLVDNEKLVLNRSESVSEGQGLVTNGKADYKKPEDPVFCILMTRISEGFTWEHVKYRAMVKAGNQIAEAKYVKIHETGELTKYRFITKAQLGDWDLFSEKSIIVEILIDYTYIDDSPLFPFPLTEDEKLAEDIFKCFKDQRYADIIVKCDGEEIPAQKSVLCVKAYQFDNDLQDNPALQKRLLKLDLDSEVVIALLRFIYCGGIPLYFSSEKFEELCSTADKFKLPRLKKIAINLAAERGISLSDDVKEE